jgi:ankyrin repeat protein
MLLKYGAAVDAETEHGNTSLHISARNGYLEAVSQLLAYGANTEKANAVSK